MKTFTKSLLAASCVLASTGVLAEDGPFSANVALTTDYVWRGISQTNEDPAIQGGFDAVFGGFYVGTWASNVEFKDDAHMEQDWYLGYGGGAGPITYDVGYIAYTYHGNSDLNFEEGYIGVGYKWLSAKLSNDFENDNLYAEIGAEFELGGAVTLGLHYGDYSFDDSTSDYSDYKVSASKEFGGFDFELAYTDTDIDADDLADGRVFLTISKSM
ncbi:MAG: hypothetical protein DSZ32_04010 [Gammaproteobacteria bacterium]|nr:MAG: hypothetical protein DSZ32_04010 [Gammaproteobacteria bacterium]